MKKGFVKYFVLAGIVLFSMTAATAGEIKVKGEMTIDEESLREIIIQTIKDNPKLIYETVNEYVREERNSRKKQQLETSFKNRITGLGITPGNPVKGAEKALITIVEYTDFQCPYCKRGADTVYEVLKKYPEKVKVVFKNNPLDFHKQAVPAAKAALAANKQGKFWEYHDLLFKNPSGLKEELFVKYAEELKLDMEKFNKDRNSEEIAKLVESDLVEAKVHKFTSTPVFVVNGVVVRGAQSADYFSKVIDRLLAEKDGNQKGVKTPAESPKTPENAKPPESPKTPENAKPSESPKK